MNFLTSFVILSRKLKAVHRKGMRVYCTWSEMLFGGRISNKKQKPKRSPGKPPELDKIKAEGLVRWWLSEKGRKERTGTNRTDGVIRIWNQVLRERGQGFVATGSKRCQMHLQSKVEMECIHTVKKKKQLYLNSQASNWAHSGLRFVLTGILSSAYQNISNYKAQITFGCLTLTPSCSPPLVLLWLPSR